MSKPDFLEIPLCRPHKNYLHLIYLKGDLGKKRRKEDPDYIYMVYIILNDMRWYGIQLIGEKQLSQSFTTNHLLVMIMITGLLIYNYLKHHWCLLSLSIILFIFRKGFISFIKKKKKKKKKIGAQFDSFNCKLILNCTTISGKIIVNIII